MKNLIEKAKSIALNELNTFGSPTIEHFNLSNSVGQRLAKELGADLDIVMLGTILMDVKIGECLKEGKVSEHVSRSVNFSKAFLEKENVDSLIIEKVLNCVGAHHKQIPFSCVEAEICANADCYRFLHPRGLMSAIKLWSKRTDDLDEIIKNIDLKVDEKKNILTLKICKDELDLQYKTIKKLLKEAKN